MNTTPVFLLALAQAGALAQAPLPLPADVRLDRDIAYAEPKQSSQTLDIYRPAAAKKLPVVVWIHGGGWRAGDKTEVAAKPAAFVHRGLVFISVNYRFVTEVPMETIARDVAKSVRWAYDHAARYGGDPNRILLMGHSAGAQLAALLCTDDRYLKAEKLSLTAIKGCVPVDGDTYDLPMRIATVHKKGDKKLAERDKQRFGDESTQKDLSSITHIAKGKHIPPFLILHVADHPETRGQSQRLLQVLQEAGIPAK